MEVIERAAKRAVSTKSCSVCATPFEVHFRYQLEQRVEQAENGEQRIHYDFFCSQRCLERSHHVRAGGRVECDACATRFHVELASQVLFTGGRRHYACSSECRARVREGVRAIRMGELMRPPPLLDHSASAAQDEAPSSEHEIETIPAGPPDGAEATPDGAEAMPAVLDPTLVSLPPSARVPRFEIEFSRRRPSVIREDVPRVLSVFNHKGGTGKTTTAITLAAGLAARGARVLLIDADGQGNVGASLGLEFSRSLYHLLVMGLPVAHIAISVRDGLDVVPANETLAAAELYLAGRHNRHELLATRLRGAVDQYDAVIIDCSPSLSLLNQNALLAADGVLCPVACDYLSLVGVRQVLRTVKQVNKHLAHLVRLWGVLPTMFDARARICHDAVEALRGHFGERCFDPIRLATRVKEAPAQSKTLFEYAPGSGAAFDYGKLVERMILHSEFDSSSQALGGVG